MIASGLGVGKKCIGEEEWREANRKREWEGGRKFREIRRGRGKRRGNV